MYNFKMVPYYEKKNNWFYVSRLLIPAVLIIAMMYCNNQGYEIFHQLVEILCITLGGALASISTTKYNKNSVFTYIGIGFGLIAIMVTIHSLQFDISNYIVGMVNFETIIWLSVNYLEYFVVLIAFYAIKRKSRYKKIVIFYAFLSIVIFSIIAFIFIFQDSIFVNISCHSFVCINLSFIFILLIADIVCIIKYRNILLKKERIYLIVYLIFVTIYEALVVLYFGQIKFVNKNIICIAHIFKYLAYYVLYEAMAGFVIKKCYEEMYIELTRKERDHKFYNKMLNERRRMLLEVNSMVKKSKNNYTKLVNSIQDSIVIFSDEKIYYINESALNLCNLKHVEQLSDITKFQFADYLKKYNRPFLTDLMLSDKMGFCSTVFKNECGQEQLVELYLIELETELTLLFMRDITNIKNMNLVRIELEKYLQEEDLKREFFSNISHELRTPINVIFSAIQLNDLYLSSNTVDGIKNNNTIIGQNCLRLIRTINNFIDANKISEGYILPEMMYYNIVELVENIAQLAYKYIKKMGISLIFDSEEEEIVVCCDREQMERIMLNLLSNCVKYGRDGGHIWVNIKTNGQEVEMVVGNDGYSISEEEKPYIFDKFTRANKSFNRPQEGSGLGLYITKSLVELQNGNISVHESNNKGVSFILKFKRCRDIIDYESIIHNDIAINNIMEKVDIEFSDIYM